jgi:polysaccharide biosynthesis transport protein
MTLHQFLLALRGRLWIFLSIVGATFAAVVLVTLLMPRTYDGIVSILADIKDEQMLNTPAQSPRMQLGYMQTQIDILQSQRVARKVVEDLKLHESPGIQAVFQKKHGQGDIKDWIAGGLLADLKVDSSQSSVIVAKYSSDDPKFAADVANAFAKAYVDTVLRLRTEPTREAASWFNDQLKELRSAFEQAQARLAEFERENGIIATDERLDVEVARLNELSAQSLRAADLNYDAGARAGQARAGLGSETSPDVIANPLVMGLKGELLRAEAKLQELATRIGPNHPQYQQQAAEVAALRDRVSSESRKVVGGVQSAAGQSSARRAALERDMAEQRKKVETLRQARHRSQVLIRDVDTAQKAYEAALQRYLVNKVESGAKSTNVAILNAATVPVMPSKPKIPLNLALGLFVGLILGCAAVFFLEILDRRVRSHDDLETIEGAPLIGTLQTWQPSALLGGGGGTRALPNPT